MEDHISEIQDCLCSKVPVEKAGNSKSCTIDKNGRFYHATQKTWCGLPLFDADIARYRHHMLCELCIKHNVTILYSVVMPTHTHDVLYSDSWRNISTVLQIINSCVVRYASKRHEKRKGYPMFCERPQYTVVKDIQHLHFLGKYVYDNASSLKIEGRTVPFDCFWMFEKDRLRAQYNRDLYSKLFGKGPKELYDYYRGHTKQEVWRDSKEIFGFWSAAQNDVLFKANPNVPWSTTP